MAAYEEMLTSDDVPLNIDDLCSTMGADSGPSNFSSGFLLPDRPMARPITADRLERRDTAGMRWSTGSREPPALPRTTRRLHLEGGSSCSFRVRARRSGNCRFAPCHPSSLHSAYFVGGASRPVLHLSTSLDLDGQPLLRDCGS